MIAKRVVIAASIAQLRARNASASTAGSASGAAADNAASSGMAAGAGAGAGRGITAPTGRDGESERHPESAMATARATSRRRRDITAES